MPDYGRVNRFLEELETLCRDPVRRKSAGDWQALLQSPVLENRELRENLSFRVFYHFIELLEQEQHLPADQRLPPACIHLFADHFEWNKNVRALAGHYGTARVNLVLAYGESGQPPGSAPRQQLQHGRRRSRRLLPALLATLLLTVAGAYLLQRSIENYRSSIPYYSCRILFSDARSQEHLAACSEQARAGDGHAMLLLGLGGLYSADLGMEARDALEQVRNAAEAGTPGAAYLLGALYGGDLMPGLADLNAARYWLERAADAGNPYAGLHLATLYVGQSDTSGEKTAMQLMSSAAAEELPLAYLGMALFEYFGIGVEPDPALARNWLDLFALASIPEGTNEAAWLLSTSEAGDLRDPEQALKYIPYLAGSEEDSSAAMYVDTIAAIHAANLDFRQAVSTQKHAIDLLEDMNTEVYNENIDGFRDRLAAYESGMPWSEQFPIEFLENRLAGIRNQLFTRELTRVIADRGSAPADTQ